MIMASKYKRSLSSEIIKAGKREQKYQVKEKLFNEHGVGVIISYRWL